MSNLTPKLALTYDDVLIKPGFSEILPADANVKSKFSKNIELNIPIVSAAMDTVTEGRAAIVLAQQGGIGVVHKNLSPEDQAKEVRKVKKFEAGMILDPVTVSPEASLSDVFAVARERKVTGMPVVDRDDICVGIITSRDTRFESDLSIKVKDIMTTGDRLITAKKGIDPNEAQALLHKHRIEKLPVLDEKKRLVGLITIKDIMKKSDFPNSNQDRFGRLRVAAAMGVGDKEFDRAIRLVEAGVDALVVDTAHGHSKGVVEMVSRLKQTFAEVDIIAGNVATAKACEDLAKAGADGVKVGIGPGSICTTRVVAGIGVPQLGAIAECAVACKKLKIPMIADGGIKYSGDIVKAIAAGASCVMLGSLFAGCDETPGEMILYQGRHYKVYRGMGSLGAMALGSKDRYGQGAVDEIQKLVPEGIEGQVPYRGSLASNIYQMLGGLRAGMGYVGASTIAQLQEKAEFIQITQASLKESHPHDVMITKEAPNYQKS